MDTEAPVCVPDEPYRRPVGVTDEIVEEFDDCYYEPMRAIERRIRHDIMDGKRHVWEAEMKERRRTRDHPAPASRPATPEHPS